MLVTDGKTGELSSGMMLVGDGRKGVNRIGLIIVKPIYRSSRIALRAVEPVL